MKDKKNGSKKNISIIIIAVIFVSYIILFFADRDIFRRSIDKFIILAVQIAPILLLIFILMFINFWLIKPDMVKKYLGKQSGIKGYLFSILAGIISVGSVYVWYPLLKDLKKRGMTNKLIAVFIYNRSIKLHLLPLMILYFGVNFSIILTILTILFSLIVGYFVQNIDEENLREDEQ
jgi:uncharacterized membrane protein YraQ (UPF0718 family)